MLGSFDYIPSFSLSLLKEKPFYLYGAQDSFIPPRYGKRRKQAAEQCFTFSGVHLGSKSTGRRNTKQLRIVASGDSRGKQERQIGEGAHSCFF